jgi:ADP-glucose pyrophosphorylase
MSNQIKGCNFRDSRKVQYLSDASSMNTTNPSNFLLTQYPELSVTIYIGRGWRWNEFRYSDNSVLFTIINCLKNTRC